MLICGKVTIKINLQKTKERIYNKIMVLNIAIKRDWMLILQMFFWNSYVKPKPQETILEIQLLVGYPRNKPRYFHNRRTHVKASSTTCSTGCRLPISETLTLLYKACTNLHYCTKHAKTESDIIVKTTAKASEL